MIALLNNTIDKNTKTIKVSNRKVVRKSWLTPGLLKCMRNRDKLHQKSIKHPDNEMIVTKDIEILPMIYSKKSKRNTILNEIKMASKEGNKKLWSTIKSITHTTKLHSDATELLDTPDPTASKNSVNSFFTNIGRSLSESCPPVDNNILPPQKSFPNSLVLLSTDDAEIESLVLNLRSDCASGGDNILYTFLKRYREILVPVLTYIFNLAINTGKFPNAFKLAEIHPIHKSGDRDRVHNYRPISILPTLSKILERIINKRLNEQAYLETNSLLSSS